MTTNNAINLKTQGTAYYNGTGVFTGVDASTAGFVLTSNGTGAAPSFQSAAGGSVVGVVNIGFSYTAGTFTVHGYNGSALSSSNPGFVTLRSKTLPGESVIYRVTANQTFTDGTSGTTDNQRFGLTTGVAGANIPFFLYAVGDDSQTTIAFMISRIPHAPSSPSSAQIGKGGAVVNVGNGDFFCLPDVTISSYDQNPCLVLGSFRMTFAAATDSWTVQTITSDGNFDDGIGRFNESVSFVFPRGQFGAAAGKYFADNGGTAPDDNAGSLYRYSIQRNGYCSIHLILGPMSTAGVGAVALTLAYPYGLRLSAGGGVYSPDQVAATILQPNNSGAQYSRVSSAADAYSMTNADVALNSFLEIRVYGAFAYAFV